MNKSTKQEIESDSQILEQKIREYCRSQKETWRKVPYLALMANGRTGFNDEYSRAYSSGYWALDSSAEEGYYHAILDLESGEILDSFSLSGGTICDEYGDTVLDPVLPMGTLADRKYVLNLVDHLDEIDASAIAEELIEQAKEPYSEYYDLEDRIKTEKMRESFIKNGLSENYTRTKK